MSTVAVTEPEENNNGEFVVPESQSFSTMRPHFELVRANMINVDPEYQLPRFKEFHAKRIKKNFRWDLFGVIDINERADGSLWVFDGQHRLRAAMDAYGENCPIPSIVYQGGTQQWEAEQFDIRQRSRLRISALDNFRSRVIYGEPTAVKVNAIVEQHGFRVPNGTQDGPTVIRAIGALTHIDSRYAEGVLDRTLNVAVGAWNYKETLQNGVLLGIARCISSTDDLGVDARLIAALGATRIQDLATEAKRQANDFDDKLPHRFPFVIRDVHNKKYPRKKIVLRREGDD